MPHPSHPPCFDPLTILGEEYKPAYSYITVIISEILLPSFNFGSDTISYMLQ
jgi:hypothetical protein